ARRPAGGGREAEGRDPQAALPRATLHRSRRADLRAHPGRGRRGARHAESDGGGRAGDRADDHPQVSRGHGLRGCGDGAAPRELVEALIGQRDPVAGRIRVDGRPYRATRRAIRFHGTFSLPEEPLRNGCVATMSLAENMALRNFDRVPIARGPWLRRRALRRQAERWMATFKVKAQGVDAPMATL